MHRPFSHRAARRASRALLLALALLAAVQGALVASLAARGPLHVHAGATPALVDFRRDAMPVAFPHVHGPDDAARHHHGPDDPTRIALEDEAARAASAAASDDGRLAASVPVPCADAMPRVADADARDVFARRPDRAWRSRAIAPPERPPRSA